MFKLSHEVPIALLEKSKSFNDYDYALVHLFDSYSSYYNFFVESLKEGREVILDNSAYELGHPYNSVGYRAWIENLWPTEYILPDYRDDAIKNFKAISEWKHPDVSSKKIGVVHGENYKAFCENYKDIKPYVDKIAFSFESFFFELSKKRNITPAGARALIINNMVEDGVIDTSFPHHILGALSPTEYQSYVDYDWIQSVDTSNPVLHGLLNIKYEGLEGLTKKSSVKMNDIIETTPTHQELETVMYNVNWFRSQFGGKVNYQDLPKAPYPHILEEALRIVSNGRNSDLQSKGPGQSFELIVPLFNQLTGHNLSIADGAKFMMMLKLVRQQSNPKRDNLVDLVGYTSILNDIES